MMGPPLTRLLTAPFMPMTMRAATTPARGSRGTIAPAATAATAAAMRAAAWLDSPKPKRAAGSSAARQPDAANEDVTKCSCSSSSPLWQTSVTIRVVKFVGVTDQFEGAARLVELDTAHHGTCWVSGAVRSTGVVLAGTELQQCCAIMNIEPSLLTMLQAGFVGHHRLSRTVLTFSCWAHIPEPKQGVLRTCSTWAKPRVSAATGPVTWKPQHSARTEITTDSVMGSCAACLKGQSKCLAGSYLGYTAPNCSWGALRNIAQSPPLYSVQDTA